jgi:hypothetical protein
MDEADMNIAALAQETLVRIAHLDADMQCNVGGSALRELRLRAQGSQQQAIDHALEVMGKFPNFARARAAVVIKALKGLGAEGV